MPQGQINRRLAIQVQRQKLRATDSGGRARASQQKIQGQGLGTGVQCYGFKAKNQGGKTTNSGPGLRRDKFRAGA
jgi:hypothetical protein